MMPKDKTPRLSLEKPTCFVCVLDKIGFAATSTLAKSFKNRFSTVCHIYPPCGNDIRQYTMF